jgi:hypothetical protein
MIMNGRRIGVTTAYTSPSKKYNCRDGRFSPNPILPGFIAFSLSLSVFTINMFFKWYITNGFTRRISLAIPAHPSTIMKVMKNVAFIGMATPIVLGILHKEDVFIQNPIHLTTLRTQKAEAVLLFPCFE